METKIILFLIIIFSISVTVYAQESGKATYYNNNMKGHYTSDGSKYHPDSMTCAHRSYPLGTILLVQNPKNDQFVYVKVTDRGPFQKRLMIDLSYSAASKLDIIRQGIAQVIIKKLELPFILPFEALLFLPTPQALLEINKSSVLKEVLKKISVKI